MNNVHDNANEQRSRSMQAGSEGVSSIRERVDHARDIIDNVRDKAEAAFREKPYLVPVTAGAVGFGVGLLFGSKLMRFLFLTAVGTILTDTLGGEIKRLSSEFMQDLKSRLDEGEGAPAEE